MNKTFKLFVGLFLTIFCSMFGKTTAFETSIGDRISVSINWFADSFACSYVYEGKRVITCGGSSTAIDYA